MEVSARLEHAGVAHGLGGALALAYHVQDARATADIDINVSSDPQDPESLYRLLPGDVPWGPTDVEAARRDGQVRLLWPHPEGPARVPIPLDIFFPQHEFHALVASRVEPVPMLGAVVPVISATDLVVFKSLFNRSKDWPDIEELVRYGKVDVQEARRWVEVIVGPQDPRVARLTRAVEDGRASHPQVVTATLFRPSQ